MDLLSKSDEEIFEIGKPFWENLVRSSNLKDYGGFTRDFSTQMLFGANEVELGKQWANNKLIVNLNETYEPFGTLRRGDHIRISKNRNQFTEFEEFYNFINKEKKVTIFLVEQNAKKALELADRGYVLVNGNVTLEGTGQDLLKNKDIQAAYLEGGGKK